MTWSSSGGWARSPFTDARPSAAAAGCSPPVGDDHRKPLVCEPLRLEPQAAGLLHPQEVRPSVRIHQHRQRRPGLVIARQDDPHLQLPRADGQQFDDRGQERCLRA